MLMAEENEHRACVEIIDRCKRAVFAGEFEPPNVLTPDRDNPINWLHMEIVVPRCELTPMQAELEALLRRRPRNDPQRAPHERRLSGDTARWSPLL
jgi:hypothetical protein